MIAEVGRCPVCGYDLRGLQATRCPECGVAFLPTQPPALRVREQDGGRLLNEALLTAAAMSGLLVLAMLGWADGWGAIPFLLSWCGAAWQVTVIGRAIAALIGPARHRWDAVAALAVAVLFGPGFMLPVLVAIGVAMGR